MRVSIAGGAAGVWWYSQDPGIKNEWARPIFMALAAGFTVLGLAGVVYVRRYRLILHRDAIEISSFLHHRRMRFDEIAGRRTDTEQTVPRVVLVPKDARAKALVFNDDIEPDGHFLSWQASIPDLDKQENEDALNALLEDTDFGPAREIRAVRVDLARRAAFALNSAGAVIALGAMLLPYAIPGIYLWLVAALAVMPALAILIVAASNGLYVLDKPGNHDAQPSLAVFFTAPCIALAARAWIDFAVLDWLHALSIAAAAGLGTGLVLQTGLSAKDKSSRPALLLFLLVWTGGAVVFYNGLFGGAVLGEFQPRVVRVYEVPDKTTLPYLRLEPWGPRSEEGDVWVSRSLHESVAVGQRVCVSLLSGALGIRWYEISRCK